MPLRVLDAAGAGTSADVASAFAYARVRGADVVNVSFGGPDASRAVLDAIKASPDTLFVAAAGNEASDNDLTPTYPCNYSAANLLCVAASGMSDSLMSFSNYGDASVDLAAPGSMILSTVPPFVTSFRDDFEDGLAAEWLSDGSQSWGVGTDESAFATDSPDGRYGASTDSVLRLKEPLDLSGLAACRLAYRMRLDTAANDGLLVQATSDGSTWRRLSGWSGTTDGEWVPISDDLSDFDDEARVGIRFRFISDASISAEGVDLDDVSVECTSLTYDGDEYSYSSGTSMATPHVAGAAAVLWSYDRSASVGDVTAALVNGADALDVLGGYVASRGRLNLEGALRVMGATPSSGEQRSSDTDGTPAGEPDEIQEEEGETPSGGGGGGGGGTSEPVEEEAASPTPSSTSSPEPEPTGPAEGPEADRSVTLRLARHLVAKGSVLVAAEGCRAGVSVRIRRNGATIGRAVTEADGSFKVRLPDRRGRYKAVVGSQGPCAVARSPVRRHSH